MSKYSDISNGLSEVIGKLLVPAMKDTMIRQAMERLSEIAVKFDELWEESEGEDCE